MSAIHALLGLALASVVAGAADARDPAHDHATHHPAAHGEAGRPATPIPPITDADRAAAFPRVRGHMQHAREFNSYLLFDRLEAWDSGEGDGQAWEARGWLGSDLDRLWLRSEGERTAGRTGAAELELLYGRSVSPWWDVVAGVRHDFAPGRSQQWVAFGVQGLAPYMAHVSVTGYAGEGGRTMLGIEVEHEVLVTNRLILQPRLEATVLGKDDAVRALGHGLSDVEAGLRLRYEVTRQFAPYIGVAHSRAFGATGAFRRAAGDRTRDTHALVGLRIWF